MTKPFETWAVLDLMGHRRRVGRISEVEMFGAKLLRIDIPAGGDDITEFYGPAAIYSLRPIPEATARTEAARHPHALLPSELPQVSPATAGPHAQQSVTLKVIGGDQDEIPF